MDVQLTLLLLLWQYSLGNSSSSSSCFMAFLLLALPPQQQAKITTLLCADTYGSSCFTGNEPVIGLLSIFNPDGGIRIPLITRVFFVWVAALVNFYEKQGDCMQYGRPNFPSYKLYQWLR
jgi:hypothetical protein